jgi:hypothetical protein
MTNRLLIKFTITIGRYYTIEQYIFRPKIFFLGHNEHYYNQEPNLQKGVGELLLYSYRSIKTKKQLFIYLNLFVYLALDSSYSVFYLESIIVL